MNIDIMLEKKINSKDRKTLYNNMSSPYPGLEDDDEESDEDDIERGDTAGNDDLDKLLGDIRNHGGKDFNINNYQQNLNSDLHAEVDDFYGSKSV